MDLELRQVYNKFGKDGIKANKRYDETQFLLEVAIYYVSYGIMAFLLTMGKRSSEARNWILTGLIGMLVAEVAVMTSQTNPLPPWLFPQMTEADLVWWMHSLFPAFMNGCRSLGSYLYVDLDGHTRQLLLALQEQNKDILLVLREVQIGVQNASSHASSAPRLVTAEGAGQPRATPTGKLRELQDRLKSSNVQVAKAVENLKSDSSSSSGNMGFYLMIVGYIAISYLFGN
jgi:hypothetical protein